MTSWRDTTGWQGPKVTMTCECGQAVQHEQWCRAVPRLAAPTFPYNARPPRPGLFARLLGWLRIR